MTDNVSSVPSVVFANPETPPVQTPPVPMADENNNNPRLAIEQGPTGFVYKILDRVTGEVIRQLPQKSLADLAKDPEYAAGGVIKTSI